MCSSCTSFDVLDIGACGDWVPIECSITETNLVIFNYLRTTYNYLGPT